MQTNTKAGQKTGLNLKIARFVAVISFIAMLVNLSYAAIEPQWSPNSGVTGGDTSDNIAVYDQGYTHIVPDGTGSYIAIWEEKNIFDLEAYIKAQKFDANGDSVWASPTVVNTQTLANEYDQGPKFMTVTDDAGGVYVLYQYLTSFPPAGADRHIRAARVTGSGTLSWNNIIMQFSGSLNGLYLMDAIPDGSNGVLYTFFDSLPAPTYFSVRVQRLLPTGSNSWGGGGTTYTSATKTVGYSSPTYTGFEDGFPNDYQVKPKKLAITEPGYVMGAWAIKSSSTHYLLAEKMDIATGTRQLGSGFGQVVLSDSVVSGAEWKSVSIVEDDTSGAYIAWYDTTGTGRILYTQVDDAAGPDGTCGAPPEYTVVDTVPTSPMNDIQIIPDSDTSDGVILAYAKNNGSEDEIRVGYASDCSGMTTAAISHQSGENSTFPRLTGDGGDGAYVVWRTNDEDLNLQHVYINAGTPTPQFGAGGAVDHSIVTGSNSLYVNPMMLTADTAGTNNVTVAWGEFTGDKHLDNFISRVNNPSLTTANDESNAWTPAVKRVVPVSPWDGNDMSHQTVKTADGGYVVAWLSRIEYGVALWAEKFDSSGSPQWSLSSPVVDTQDSYRSNEIPFSFHMIPDGNDVIIAYSDFQQSAYAEIHVTKLNSADGSAAWSQQITNDLLDDQFFPQVLSDGGTGTFVTWHHKCNDEVLGICGDNLWDIYATRINNSNGTVHASWTGGGGGGYNILQIDGDTVDNCESRIVSDGGTGFIVTAQTNTNGWNSCKWGGIADENIHAHKVSATGSVVWNDQPIAATAGNETYHNTIADGSGNIITTYNSGGRLWAQKLNSAGATQWGPAVVAALNVNTDAPPQIVTDGSDGAIIAHQTTSNTLSAEKLNNAGTTQWGGVNLTPTTTKNALELESQYYNSAMIADGSGGAEVTWASKPSGDEGNIYRQEIDSAGSIGAEILVEDDGGTANDRYPTIIDGSSIVTWINMTGSSNGDIFLQNMDDTPYVQPANDTIEIHSTLPAAPTRTTGAGITNGDDSAPYTDHDFDGGTAPTDAGWNTADSYSFSNGEPTATTGNTVDLDSLTWTTVQTVGGGSDLEDSDDTYSVDIPLGFTATIYGKDVDTVRVTTEGFVYLNSSGDLSGTESGAIAANRSMTNYATLPSSVDGTATGDIMIAGAWEDLEPSKTGDDQILYHSDAANELFVLYFQNVEYFDTGVDINFQIKIRGNGAAGDGGAGAGGCGGPLNPGEQCGQLELNGTTDIFFEGWDQAGTQTPANVTFSTVTASASPQETTLDIANDAWTDTQFIGVLDLSNGDTWTLSVTGPGTFENSGQTQDFTPTLFEAETSVHEWAAPPTIDTYNNTNSYTLTVDEAGSGSSENENTVYYVDGNSSYTYGSSHVLAPLNQDDTFDWASTSFTHDISSQTPILTNSSDEGELGIFGTGISFNLGIPGGTSADSYSGTIVYTLGP